LSFVWKRLPASGCLVEDDGERIHIVARGHKRASFVRSLFYGALACFLPWLLLNLVAVQLFGLPSAHNIQPVSWLAFPFTVLVLILPAVVGMFGLLYELRAREILIVGQDSMEFRLWPLMLSSVESPVEEGAEVWLCSTKKPPPPGKKGAWEDTDFLLCTTLGTHVELLSAVGSFDTLEYAGRLVAERAGARFEIHEVGKGPLHIIESLE